MMRNALMVMVGRRVAAACSSDAGGQAGTMTLPAIKTQPTAQAVVDEHLDAINKCDWNRLMAQYPDERRVLPAEGRGRAEDGSRR